jgi:cytidylate kinase
MYRALALWSISQGLALDNAAGEMDGAAQRYPVEVSFNDGMTTVSLAGRDISAQLTTAEVTSAVSEVSRHPGVRAVMKTRQRVIVQRAVTMFGGVVIDGRDATTVVVPDAEVKILLLADQQTRARRVRSGEGVAEAAQRDDADSSVSDFRRPGADVTVFDTSDIELDELISRVLTHVFEWLTWHPDSRVLDQ